MSPKPNDDCFHYDPRDGQRHTHGDVVARLRDIVRPFARIENVKLDALAGRVVAKDIISGRAVPGHVNAAVDGYAFAYQPSMADHDTRLTVVGRSAAGRPYGPKIASKQAVRIFTGAVVPEGCDTVAMQEDCAVEPTGSDGSPHGSIVTIPAGLKAGANVRAAGEDLQDGDLILGIGDTVRPQDIAGLASVGRTDIPCFALPRVALVSTGDEIIRVGTGELAVGQVFDANAPMLSALIRLAGCRVSDLGVWPDSRRVVQRRLKDAADNHDLIITSGGASLGDEDHMSGAIAELGHRHVWQIAVKPGRPLMFGQINGTIIVGLPGNPVAVYVCFLMYVFPMLRRLAGAHWPEPRRIPIPANFEVRTRKIGRREFWRGTMRATEFGLTVEKYARDGSGLISGLRAAHGLIEIPEDTTGIAKGERVNFIPFTEFGIVA